MTRLAPTWPHTDQPGGSATLDALVRPSRGATGGVTLLDDHGVSLPGELENAVARLAGALRASGVHRGDTVAWQSPNRSEVVTLFRACWRIGAVAAPLHHLAGPAELDRLLAQLDPALVVDVDDVPNMIERGDAVGAGAARAADLAVVLHTSGSSGQPKGVLHTHGALAYKAALMAQVHGLHAGDTVLMPAPLAHISGLLNAVTLPAAAGLTTVLMARWDPEHALQLIERHRVSFMIGPPTFFVSLMDAPGFTPERVRSLRLVSSGGAGVSPAFVADASERLGAVVKRTYGSTEAPTVTTSYTGDDPERARTTDGRPTGRIRLRLADDGELWVRGPELFVGYTDRARNAEVITEDDWFRTGDLARIDDGWLTIEGRKGDVIIRGGENIAAAEVQAVLEAHDAVSHAAVVARPHDRLGEQVCAFVVCRPGATFDLDTCRDWFEQQGVARFKTPEVVVVVDELPVLAAGKVDLAELRRRANTPVG
jgi:acyl-CoA synthetase (AMP-forming)/AMP-acid ligase II